MMKEREEMVRVANERRRKKLEEREKAEAKAFANGTDEDGRV